MASVEPYETEQGRRYRARWRDLDRRSKEKGGFHTKRDAELFLAKTSVDLSNGQCVDPSSAKATIFELGVEWLANRPHMKPSSPTPHGAGGRVARPRRIQTTSHSATG